MILRASSANPYGPTQRKLVLVKSNACYDVAVHNGNEI